MPTLAPTPWPLGILDPLPTTGLATNPFPNTYNTDWVATSQLPGIDFASFNVYPDLWRGSNGNDVPFVDAWIQRHAADARSAPLVKPAIIKELGMQVGAEGGSTHAAACYGRQHGGVRKPAHGMAIVEGEARLAPACFMRL